MKRAVHSLNDWLAHIEGFLLCILLAIMIFLAFLQVVMRDIFNEGIPWADSVVRLLVLWVGFLGAARATKLDQNLTVEVLTKYMPDRMKHMAAAVVKIFAGIVCFFLLCASVRYLYTESTTGQKFLHLFPEWYTLLIIPITFILIPFHLVFSVINDIRYFIKGKPQ